MVEFISFNVASRRCAIQTVHQNSASEAIGIHEAIGAEIVRESTTSRYRWRILASVSAELVINNPKFVAGDVDPTMRVSDDVAA